MTWINRKPEEGYYHYEDAGIKLLNEKFCPDDPIVSTRNIKEGLYEGGWSRVDGFNKKYEVEFKFRTGNQDGWGGFEFDKEKCESSAGVIFERWIGVRRMPSFREGGKAQSICPGNEVKDLLLVLQHDLWRGKYITQVFNLSAEYDLFYNNLMLPKESRPWKGEKRFNYIVPLVHSYYDDDNRLIRERLGIFVDDPVTQPRKKAWEAYDKKTKVDETEMTVKDET
jgi:hypothetical protein